MPKVDLDQLDIQGLKGVIAEAQKRLDKRLQEEKGRFVNEMKRRAEELGLNFNELVKSTGPSGVSRRRPKGAGVTMKYQNPEQGRLEELKIGN
jgi:hypothetical protein